jgi:hypothetical protein
MHHTALLLFFLQSFFSKLNTHWHHNILEAFRTGQRNHGTTIGITQTNLNFFIL